MIIRARVIENSPAVLMARILGVNGSPMGVSDVASITVKSYNPGSAIQTGNTVIPSVSGTITPLTLDGRWKSDLIGYNFALALDGSMWPDEGATQVEVKITPSGTASPFYVVWLLAVDELYSL